LVADGIDALRVAYKVFPVTQPCAEIPDDAITWMPFLTVSLIIGHSQTKKFEAIVDSGSSTCLFHADIGKAHGLKLKSGLKGELGGVVGGAKGEVYYHKVKLCIGTDMIHINAGFSENLSVAALLGRHGFFEHFSVLFDPTNNPPGFEITRIYRT
jgi:hypothetical protein